MTSCLLSLLYDFVLALFFCILLQNSCFLLILHVLFDFVNSLSSITNWYLPYDSLLVSFLCITLLLSCFHCITKSLDIFDKLDNTKHRVCSFLSFIHAKQSRIWFLCCGLDIDRKLPGMMHGMTHGVVSNIYITQTKEMVGSMLQMEIFEEIPEFMNVRAL